MSAGSHPGVLTAIKETIDAFGAGASGSRKSGGTHHASIIDGLRHSRAEKHIFRHNDRAPLEELAVDRHTVPNTLLRQG